MQNAEKDFDEIVNELGTLNVAAEEAVLILGAGNATFALSQSLESIFKQYAHIDRFTLHVTEYIAQLDWESHHPEVREKLEKRGYVVKFEVDASNTDLVKGKSLIIFNFPYVHSVNGHENNGKEKTVELITEMMTNIVKKADCGTRVWIALATAKRNRDPLQPYGMKVQEIVNRCIAASTNIRDSDHCLLFEDALDSLLEGVKGYTHVMTHNREPNEAIWKYNEMVVYCFKVVRTPDAIFRKLRRLSSSC